MATYYWVGDSGNWDATTTTNWATSSGGTGGAGVPTSADDVIFDANSNTGTGAFTVTVTGTSAAPAVCRDFTTGGAGGALDGAMTLTMGATAFLDVYGSMTLPATNFSVSITSGATITFRATTTGKTITTNGVSLSNAAVIFDGVGGEWTLGSALTSASSYSFRGGSVVTNNFNISGNGIGAGTGTNVRSLTLGSSTVTLSGGTPVNFTVITNFTLNAGTSTISCSGTSPTFNGAGLTYYNVSFTSTSAGTATITGANTFNDLTFTTPATTNVRNISIGANQTVNGTLTLGAANTVIRRVFIYSDVVGTARTITLNGTLATLADVDFRNITAAGTVATPWTGTRLGNCLGNSNITFDAPKTVYWNLAGTQNWSATAWATTNNGTPAANNFPLAQDTAVFTEAGAAGTVSMNASWNIGEIQMADGVSNRTTAFTLSFGSTTNIYKNVTLFSNLTTSGGITASFVGQGTTQQIKSAGVTLDFPVIINTTGTFQLQDALTIGSALTFTLTQGTLDLNGYDLTCGLFSSSNSNTRSIAFGSKKIIVTGNNATVFSMSTATNFTYTGTPTVEFNYSGSTGTRGISPPGSTTGGTESNALNLNITAGTDIISVSSSRIAKNFNFTGFGGTFDLAGAFFVYGNLTFSSGMTINSSIFTLSLLATSGTQQITSNGKTVDFPVTKQGAGTLTLNDSLTIGSTRTLTHTAGTISLGAFNLTTGLYSSTGSTTRQLDVGTGTFTNSGATFTVSGTNFSTAGTGTISMTSGSSKTFAGGSFSYPTLNQGGAGELIITGTNTFARLSNSVNGTTITFPNVTTNVADWKVNGVVGSVTTIQRTGASGTFTLNYTGSGTAQADYLSISNSTATPSNTWYAGTRSTDGGGNTGWSFTFTTGTRYWVGGSGNWDASTTTNWAVASGGTGGVPAPTATDSVIFDANSNTGTSAFTVTVTGTSAAPAVCQDFTASGLDGAMTMLFATNGFLDCYGSMTLPATNFTWTGSVGVTSTLRFRVATTGKTLTTNGVNISNTDIRIAAETGGELSLGSALSGNYSFFVDAGTFKTANYNLTIARLQSNTISTRSIELGSSIVTFTFSSVLNISNNAGLTFNAGTSTIVLNQASQTFAGAGLTFYNVSFTSTSAGTATITGANTFNDLTFTSKASLGNRLISIGANQTVNGTLTFGAANTAIIRVQLFSDVVGTARTITLNGTLATLADVDFKDITAAGTVATPWTGTRLGNGGGNTNITFDAAKTVYRVGTGNWSSTQWALTSGGSVDINNFPLAQDTIIFDANTTTGTHTINSNWWIGTLDMSALNVAVTLATAANTPTFYGNVTLDADVTLTGTGAISFSGAANQTVISAGKTWTQPLTVNKPTTTSLLLGDALTIGSTLTFTLTQGTLDLNGYDLTCGVFSSDNSNTRSINFGAKRIYVADTRESGVQIIAMPTMTNFNYTGSGIFNVNNSGSGTKRCSAGTTAGGTESNAISIECAAGTGILKTFGHFKDINLTGYSGQYDLQDIGGNINKFIYGDMTISSTTTVLGGSTNNLTFQKSSGTQTLVSAGKTFDCPVVKSAAGTLQLSDNLTMGSTRTFTLTQGTLNLDGKTLSTGLFSSSNSNVRTLNLGANGKITVTGSGTTAWNAGTSTNLTLSGTGTVELTSASAKTFAGGSKVYPYTLNQGGTGTLTITGSNTFEDMTNTVQPTTITFTAGTTTSVKDFSVSGIPGSLVTLNSSSPGTQWNLAKV